MSAGRPGQVPDGVRQADTCRRRCDPRARAAEGQRPRANLRGADPDAEGEDGHPACGETGAEGKVEGVQDAATGVFADGASGPVSRTGNPATTTAPAIVQIGRAHV